VPNGLMRSPVAGGATSVMPHCPQAYVNPNHGRQYQRKRQFTTVRQVDKQEHRGERPDEGRCEAAEINQRGQPRRPLVTPADLLQALFSAGVLLLTLVMASAGENWRIHAGAFLLARIRRSIVPLPALLSLMRTKDLDLKSQRWVAAG